jgi:hypothetical protein
MAEGAADNPQSIVRPQRVYDFAALSRREPNRQQPGDRLDAQFDNLIQAVNALANKLDALKQPQSFNDLPDQFKRDLVRFVTAHVDAAAADVTAALNRAESLAPRLSQDFAAAVAPVYSDLEGLERRTTKLVQTVMERVGRLEMKLLNLESAPAPQRVAPPTNPGMPMLTIEFAPGIGPAPDYVTQYAGPPEAPTGSAQIQGDPTYTGVLYPQAGGFYGAGQLDAGASPVAADYAQVAIEWAEHMPDQVPPNVLATTGITGQHYSSRYWATQAAGVFGGYMAWYYLGPFHTINAPTTAPGGPLQVGMIYYDIDKQQMMVWNGTAWQGFSRPEPAVTATLYYQMTEGQTVIVLTANDYFGQSTTLLAGQGLNIYMTGARLVPLQDYTVNVAASTITLTQGAPGGSFLNVDTLVLASQLAPTATKIKKLKPLTPAFDGVTTVFTLACADGTTINVTGDEQLLVSLDGVEQEPTIAFSAFGAGITFMYAPSADSYFFGVWFLPGGA